ncbi:hypothetical protein E4U47_000065 [Claviceps purpurea]|nr:hypothetical protein E4U48_003017 [Claviceps purpurea]KAG6281202.1 hypothetical protein E4U47_000065 [Claviceps purpurea]
MIHPQGGRKSALIGKGQGASTFNFQGFKIRKRCGSKRAASLSRSDIVMLRRLENAMYLQKTAPGPAIDDDEKLGRQVSTLHLTLWQGGQVLFWTMRRGLWPPALAAKCLPLFQAVEIAAFTGLSIPTG